MYQFTALTCLYSVLLALPAVRIRAAKYSGAQASEQLPWSMKGGIHCTVRDTEMPYTQSWAQITPRASRLGRPCDCMHK